MLCLKHVFWVSETREIGEEPEVQLPEMDTSVFILGASITKTSTERVVVLNAVARQVIESRRGIHAVPELFAHAGASYGSSMPVKPLISPARAFL